MSERIQNLLLSRQFFMRMVMLHQTEQIKPPLFTSPAPDRDLRGGAVARERDPPDGRDKRGRSRKGNLHGVERSPSFRQGRNIVS